MIIWEASDNIYHQFRRIFRDTLRLVPLRRVKIYKNHPDLADLTARLRWRHRLDADDRRLFGSLADHIKSRQNPDVRGHFARASSNSAMLRLLKDLAAVQASTQILEIGTGYGLSAIALSRTPAKPHIVTIENSEIRMRIAEDNISFAKSDRITCILAEKSEALSNLMQNDEKFDFIFHDGGHSGDDYVRDFEVMRQLITPGSLIIFDDIAWDRKIKTRAFTKTKSARSCIEGWRDVVASPSVQWAFAISGKVGVLRVV